MKEDNTEKADANAALADQCEAALAHPDPDDARDAERYRHARHRAWLRDKPYATFTEQQWKDTYDDQHDNAIEDAAMKDDPDHA